MSRYVMMWFYCDAEGCEAAVEMQVWVVPAHRVKGKYEWRPSWISAALPEEWGSKPMPGLPITEGSAMVFCPEHCERNEYGAPRR